MSSLTQKLVVALKREDGGTAVEYAVMLALIICFCVATVASLSSSTKRTIVTIGRMITSSS